MQDEEYDPGVRDVPGEFHVGCYVSVFAGGGGGVGGDVVSAEKKSVFDGGCWCSVLGMSSRESVARPFVTAAASFGESASASAAGSCDVFVANVLIPNIGVGCLLSNRVVGDDAHYAGDECFVVGGFSGGFPKLVVDDSDVRGEGEEVLFSGGAVEEDGNEICAFVRCKVAIENVVDDVLDVVDGGRFAEEIACGVGVGSSVPLEIEFVECFLGFIFGEVGDVFCAEEFHDAEEEEFACAQFAVDLSECG